MNCFLNLVIIVLTIVSATNCAVINHGKSLLPQITILLNELRSTPMDAILYWNWVTLQACGNDYDPSVAETPDKVGPTETARAFAIIHGAMYDSMAAFNGFMKPIFQTKSIPNIDSVDKKFATNGAIAEAAYQTLYAMYPKQRPIFDAVRTEYLKKLKPHGNQQVGVDTGIFVGKLIAGYILANRKNDGSQDNTPYTPILKPGYHRVDPTHPDQGYLSPNWGKVKPFFLAYGSQFRPSNVVGEIPASRLKYLNSDEFVKEFLELKSFGSKTSSVRTPDQTEIGISWAYDGAPKLGVPPRLYNQVVRVIAIQQKNTLQENAFLFALVNYAMGDAGIAAWECKYHYNFWRPIAGVRNAVGRTQADPNWVPLGSPNDNAGTTFTPGFPSYVSGHSTFGSAVFESLRQFYKKDNIKFKFQSDEYNGKTFDSNTGKIRPARTRYYQSFTQAETENYLSRIYLGVHWRNDQEQGRTLGRNVARYVYNKFI